MAKWWNTLVEGGPLRNSITTGVLGTRSFIGRGMHAIGRLGRNTVGTFSGYFEWNRLRGRIQTYAAREKLLEKIDSSDFRKMCRIARHLRRYNTDTFDKINARYARSPRVLENHIRYYVEMYVDDVDEFYSVYRELLKALCETVKCADIIQATYFDELLKDFEIIAEEIAPAGNFVSTDKTIKLTKKRLENLAKRHLKFLRKSERNPKKILDRVRRGRRVSSYTASFFWTNWIFFSFRRLLDVASRRAYERIDANWKEILRQMERKKIQTNFFPKIQQIIRDLRIARNYSLRVRQDVWALQRAAGQFYVDVRKSLMTFEKIYQNDPEIKELRKSIQEIEVLADDLIKTAKWDQKELVAMEDSIKKFNDEMPQLLELIKQYSFEHLKAIEEGSKNYLDRNIRTDII